MIRVDSVGRVLLPKKIRERYNLKENTELNVVEGNNELILQFAEKKYLVNELQMEVIRELYIIANDTMLLDDTKLKVLAEICGASNATCPNCGNPMFLTSEDSYKCIKCSEK